MLSQIESTRARRGETGLTMAETLGNDRRRSTRFGPYLVSLVHLAPGTIRSPGDNFGNPSRTVRIAFVYDGQLTLTALGTTAELHPSHAAMAVGWRPLDLSSTGTNLVEVDIAVDSSSHNFGLEEEGLVVWRPETVLPSATAAALRELISHPGVAGEIRNETTRVVEQLITALLNLRPGPQLPPAIETMERSRIVNYIAEHYADKHLTPAAIAEHFRISTRTLHRMFEGTEHTVCQAIATERLNAATAMLIDPKQTRTTIEEVADVCGYGSGLALRRAVLAATGQTPSQLRNASREAQPDAEHQ